MNQPPISLTPPPSEQRTLNAQQAAERIGCGRASIYELIRTKQLRSIRIGRKVLITPEAIEEFLAGEGTRKLHARR